MSLNLTAADEGNLTGVDEGVYFVVSSVVSVCMFSFVVLPALILCLLCVLALIFVKDIKRKITILLINIFAAELCNWFSYTIYYLGFPARIVQPGEYSCHLFTSLTIIVAVQKFTAGALYAVMVYIFIKHGERKIKWYLIAPFIAVSWIVVVCTVGITPFLSEFGTENRNGFCTADAQTNLFPGVAGIVISTSIVSICVTVVFCILTFVYIKKNTLEGSVGIKKAVAKILLYISISTILSLIGNVTPLIIPVIAEVFALSDPITLTALNHLLRFFFVLPSFANPIAALVFLKPLHTAMKQMYRKFICAYHKPNMN